MSSFTQRVLFWCATWRGVAWASPHLHHHEGPIVVLFGVADPILQFNLTRPDRITLNWWVCRHPAYSAHHDSEHEAEREAL